MPLYCVTPNCVTPHFLKENEILQFASFHYWHNQNFGAAHSLNIYKVVILAEFLKNICARVNFSKVRGLKACNVSNDKYFCRYFSKILLNLIRQLLEKHFSITASNKA